MSDNPRSELADGFDVEMTDSQTVQQKKNVRHLLRAQRRARSEQKRSSHSQHLVEHALAAGFLHDARAVASFLPLPTEPDITALNNALAARGIDILIPVMLDDKDLTWRLLDTDDDLGKDAIARADVILTPALALGPQGERLGQGGGSYDRALPRRKKDAVIVGVTFADEIDQIFPCENHDERVHMSLTERGFRNYESPIPGVSLKQ